MPDAERMPRKREIHGYQVQIDADRKVQGFIPEPGHVQFRFWNGAACTTIQLSDEAFLAAVNVYTHLQRDIGKKESKRKDPPCAT